MSEWRALAIGWTGGAFIAGSLPAQPLHSPRSATDQVSADPVSNTQPKCCAGVPTPNTPMYI